MASALQHTPGAAYCQLAQPTHSTPCSQTLRPSPSLLRHRAARFATPLIAARHKQSLTAPLSHNLGLHSSRRAHTGQLQNERSSFFGSGASEPAAGDVWTDRARESGRLHAVGGNADAGEESAAGPSGRAGSPWDEGTSGRQGSTATAGGPLIAVLGAIDGAVRFVIVKLLLVLHRLLLLGARIISAVWRFSPIQAVKNRTSAAVEPIVYGDGAPTFTTPWFLKPFELVVRIALFFVPEFVKRRVGPVLSKVFGTTAERTLALVRKGAKEGLGGVRDWADETYVMAQEGAPEARRVSVQVLYRLLQFFAFTILLQFVAGLRHSSLYDLAWVPKGIVTLWRWMWAVIDYVLLDMDWVQPLQRLIVDHIWPLWRDYWILAALCTVIWERLNPTLQTDYDIYTPPIEDE